MSGAVVCEQGECSKLLYAVSCVGLSLLSSLQFMEGGDLRAALVSDAELAWYGKGHMVALSIARGLVFLDADRHVGLPFSADAVLSEPNICTPV